MKKYIPLFLIALLFTQCQEHKEAKEIAAKEHSILQNEELVTYALSQEQEIYGVEVALLSPDTCVVQYKVIITRGNQTEIDSLTFPLFANEKSMGQILFKELPVDENAVPTFTSKLTILEK